MQKAGIPGGGQLGRMLLQAAANYPVETFVLENDPACPSAYLCTHFIKGDITYTGAGLPDLCLLVTKKSLLLIEHKPYKQS